MPPVVGDAGVVVPVPVGAPGAVVGAEAVAGTVSRIAEGGAVRRVTTERAMEVAKKAAARIPVARVSTLPWPRDDRNAFPPPIPSAPPSERWRSTTAIRATITIR